MIIGKEKRLNRLYNGHDRIIILPLDHGFTEGPIDGIENMGQALSDIVRYNVVDSVILHRGAIIHNYSILSKQNLGLIMHLSGSTSLYGNGLHKIQTGTVDEAISLGCDGVSVHINLGNEYEPYMLENTARIAEECGKKGMPLIAMVYVRGDEIENERKLPYLKRAVRLADEIGADIVKVNLCMEGENFSEVVNSCQIPVVIAGGQQKDYISLLRMVDTAMKSGAKGISIGRNIFQSSNYSLLLNNIKRIVHEHEDISLIMKEYLAYA
ncbi:fructose-bisphosphate aldolase [Mobilitalea sibirica]|uniref:Fructose-bisphosphate aldolase n=1 Tax=Mobilitalea sibirica TaxID=1462919 RepID=A0A8J7HD47_9FIRM|nr:2-amino-3,7-dideoxy-D-threo-hept-6-ulosonate synthase [Mobilitalea sibirica]MBH1940429.1 fructose-bisphosphate aldolase [Mobilitalea sibirica]